MNFATEMTLRSALALSPSEFGDQRKAAELALGYSIIAQARWLDPGEWTKECIVTQDDRRIRLVALQARCPHTGAFTRLIENIIMERHVPVIVAPDVMLTEWCRRHWFRKRNCGIGHLRHVIWYPQRCRY
jgi:hypothetical protein